MDLILQTVPRIAVRHVHVGDASGRCGPNPVTATGKAIEEVSRNRVLSDEEIAAVWASCRDDDHGRIVRILLLTGQRREEVGAMRWSEINRAKAMWSLPPERTKNGLPHDVPLSRSALSIIEGTAARSGAGSHIR